MKTILSFALLACMAMSAPTAPVSAHDEAVNTVNVERVSAAADIEFASLALHSMKAAGCCDQGYEVKSMTSMTSTIGCCDQGYEVNSMSGITRAMIALVMLSVGALAWTTSNHFKTTTARWTS